MVHFVSETAQVELESGRVLAPCLGAAPPFTPARALAAAAPIPPRRVSPSLSSFRLNLSSSPSSY